MASRSLNRRVASALQLKRAAFDVGLPTTGTKLALETAIRSHLLRRLPFGKAGRIVSVDMGIKNLGICVLEAPHLADSNSPGKQQYEENSPIKIISWKTIDVLKNMPPEAGVQWKSLPQEQKKENSTVFGPSVLSKSALQVTRHLLSYQPSQILIERQRFRSGGKAAVQEWTIRVNMLESMLWACFEAMRQESAVPIPDVYEVSPRRVATYWCSAPTEYTTDESPYSSFQVNASKKIDKKAKISVVRSWLSHASAPDEQQYTGPTFEYSEDARRVVENFLSEDQKGRRSKSGSGPALSSGSEKLDDLADCLLQGVAWVRWEQARRRMRETISFSKDDEDGASLGAAERQKKA